MQTGENRAMRKTEELTEGFDSADLKEAKAVLDALAS